MYILSGMGRKKYGKAEIGDNCNSRQIALCCWFSSYCTVRRKRSRIDALWDRTLAHSASFSFHNASFQIKMGSIVTPVTTVLFNPVSILKAKFCTFVRYSKLLVTWMMYITQSYIFPNTRFQRQSLAIVIIKIFEILKN